MSTQVQELTETTIKTAKKTVDRSIRALMAELEHENTLLADSPNARVQRVLKVYRGMKPLLSVLANLPILPQTWRAALVVFTQVLEALATGELPSNDFKAGRDL